MSLRFLLCGIWDLGSVKLEEILLLLILPEHIRPGGLSKSV